MDGVKLALGNKGMMAEDERQCVKDRKEWRALVPMKMIEYDAAIFALLVCSFGQPSRALMA